MKSNFTVLLAYNYPRFGTIPNGATDFVVKNNFPEMHSYMKQYRKHPFICKWTMSHPLPFKGSPVREEKYFLI